MKKDAILMRLAIGFDQLLNALLGGDIDETLSSRAYRRTRTGSRKWQRIESAINAVFFWQHEHCRESFRNERQRRWQWLELYDTE